MRELAGRVLVASLCWFGASMANARTTGSGSLPPKVIVLLMYSAEMECGRQHPELKTELDGAYAGWQQRNVEVVKLAEQDQEIAEMMKRVKANDYPGKPGPVPIVKCQEITKALNDPSSDFIREKR
jgi:type III secretory pathway lipoprotein EscJ